MLFQLVDKLGTALKAILQNSKGNRGFTLNIVILPDYSSFGNFLALNQGAFDFSGDQQVSGDVKDVIDTRVRSDRYFP